MLELWMDLPAWLRMLAGLAVIGVGAAMVYGCVAADHATAGESRRGIAVGAAIGAVGLVLILAGGRSNAEKNGYHF